MRFSEVLVRLDKWGQFINYVTFFFLLFLDKFFDAGKLFLDKLLMKFFIKDRKFVPLPTNPHVT